MKRHLATGSLGCVEGAAEVDVDGLVEEGWFDTDTSNISLRHNKRGKERGALEKLGKLTNTSIAHKDIQSAKCFDNLGDKVCAGLGLGDVACDCDEVFLFAFYCEEGLCGIFVKSGDESVVVGAAEVVDGDFCAVAEVFKSDCLYQSNTFFSALVSSELEERVVVYPSNTSQSACDSAHFAD